MHAEMSREGEQWLYRASRLLEEQRFHAWLDRCTDDVRYWTPVRRNRAPTERKAIVFLDPDRSDEAALRQEDNLAIFDETKETLGWYIAPLATLLQGGRDARVRGGGPTALCVFPSDSGTQPQNRPGPVWVPWSEGSRGLRKRLSLNFSEFVVG